MGTVSLGSPNRSQGIPVNNSERCVFFSLLTPSNSRVSASAETCEEGRRCSLSLSSPPRAVSEIIYRRMAAARRPFGFFANLKEGKAREGKGREGRATDKKRLMRKRDNVCFFDCFFSLFLRKDNEMKIAAAPNEGGGEEEEERQRRRRTRRRRGAQRTTRARAGKNRNPNTSREMHTAL